MAIYKRDLVDINLETGNIHRSWLQHSIGYKDQKADHFGIRVFRDGTPVDLTGVSVQGVFLPPQGDPIAITSGNIVSGNVAEVVLPQACYNYDGQFTLAIKLVDSNNNVTGTVRIVDGMVDNTHASGTVAPTSAVPTYQEILSTYDAMIAATAAANGAIAATYSSSSTYAVGDYCIHDGGLYRCTTAINSGEAWTAAHWTAAKIGPDLATEAATRAAADSDLKSALSSVNNGEILYFTKNKYIDTNPSSGGIKPLNPGSANTYQCIAVECAEGDTFTVTADTTGSNSHSKAWAFVNSSGTSLKAETTGASIKNKLITAPANTVYLVVNARITSEAFVCKGAGVQKEIANIHSDITEEGRKREELQSNIEQVTGNPVYEFTPYTWFNTDNNTVDVTNQESTSYAYASVLVPCVEGDIFTITGHGTTSTHTLYAFVDSNGTIPSGGKSEGSAELTNAVVTAPADAVYLVVNASMNYEYLLAKGNTVLTRITKAESDIDGLEGNVYFPYTSFVNGNINSSGKNSSNTHPLRSGYIPIDEFVSVEVITSGYRYQLFAYDGAYGYLGYGDTTRTAKKTRDDVLAAYPGTKYIRIKLGSSDDTEYLNPANLADYGYTGLVRISQGTIERIEISGGGSSGDVDIMSMIESFKDEDGYYSESFVLTFDLSTVPKILTITAQYTGGTAPTVQIKNINPATDSANLPSPVYILGSTKEPTRKSWRIPMSSAVYTKGRIIFTIPSGTKVTIRDAQLKADQRNRNTEFGIRYHGHRGSIAPADTVEAFQLSAELGYNTMITIPKFTSDGVAICYHDDGNVSDLRMIDGSTIPDAATSPISSFSYDYITENFRIASTVWGILHVPTIEEYFRVCSLTGMKPIFSIHPASMFKGSTGTAHFNTLKSLARKWGVLKGIGIKSGDDDVMSCAKSVFGTDARYIWISGQSHDPYGIWSLCKSVGFVAQDATDLTGCEYDLTSEYFYTQTIEGADHYTATMAQIADLYAKGFKISVAETDAISGAEMVRLIGIGVTEFTVDSHISMGLDW